MRFSLTRILYIVAVSLIGLLLFNQIQKLSFVQNYRKNNGHSRNHRREDQEKIEKTEPFVKPQIISNQSVSSSRIFELPYGVKITRTALKNPGNYRSWENAQKNLEPLREKKPGENGEKVDLNSEEELLNQQTSGKFGYSKVRSDKIALDRTIPDTRPSSCKTKQYHKNLPQASIIITFHNEAKSVLLRTATSIVNRSPEKLLKEVIFVDDLSDYPEINGSDFENELAMISPKIKLFRSSKRIANIQGQILGSRKATGEVLIFMDSHVEVGINWLPPLLHPIALNFRAVVQPTHEIISEHNFGYRPVDNNDLQRGSFDWFMTYKMIPIPEIEAVKRNSQSDVFFTPVLFGGVFAIHADWWKKLKGFDPFLDIWSGEQFEMSFKVS